MVYFSVLVEVTLLVVHCFSVSLSRMLLLKSYPLIGSMHSGGKEYTALMGRLLWVNGMGESLVVPAPPVYCVVTLVLSNPFVSVGP